MPSNRHCLGVHIGHDRGAAVVSDGFLKSCIAEERLDRRKHSASPELPVLSIRAVLEIAGIQATDLAGIGISYTNVRIDDIIEQLADEIREFLGLRETPVLGVGHHDCHAWSAWCTSGKQQSLVVVADGSGDIVGHQIEAESLYEGTGSELKLIERRLQDFGLTRTDRRNAFNPAYMHELDRTKTISLGRKYEQFTYLIGFHHDESGKTMALAAYSDPLFRLSPPAFEGINFSLSFSDGIDQVIDACKSSPQPCTASSRNTPPQLLLLGSACSKTIWCHA
jgi:carbamoyltransferase